MAAFEYVMVLVSIIIGLAITHVLTAFAAGVHRLRGYGEPIRFEPVYLLWTGYVLIWLVSFWWWEFRFQELNVEWTFGLYLFIIGYAISLFVFAAILVPGELKEVDDTYSFFIENKEWFFGAHLFVLGMDIVDSFLKGADWGLNPTLWFSYAFFIAASVVGLLFERRAIQLAAAVAAFSAQLLYMFGELGVLGSW